MWDLVYTFSIQTPKLLATFSYSNTHSCTGDRSYCLRCHLVIRIGIQKHMESHTNGYALGGNLGFSWFPSDTLTHWLQGLGIKLDHCSICLRVFQDVTHSWTRDQNRGHALDCAKIMSLNVIMRCSFLIFLRRHVDVSFRAKIGCIYSCFNVGKPPKNGDWSLTHFLHAFVCLFLFFL